MERPPAPRPVIVRPVTQLVATGAQPSIRTGRQSVTLQVLTNAPTAGTACAHTGTAQDQYTYRVKIVNPLRKSDVVMRYLHHFCSKFESVITLRTKLAEQFKEQVPNTVTFNVGYFEGQQHAKVWLVSDDDLHAMYAKYPEEISLYGVKAAQKQLRMNVELGEPNVSETRWCHRDARRKKTRLTTYSKSSRISMEISLAYPSCVCGLEWWAQTCTMI